MLDRYTPCYVIDGKVVFGPHSIIRDDAQKWLEETLKNLIRENVTDSRIYHLEVEWESGEDYWDFLPYG